MKYSRRKRQHLRQNFLFGFLAVGLFLASPVLTLAAPGDLDPTFGSGGIVITRGNNINHLNEARAMAIQSDGKIIVVGEGTLGTFNWDFAVVRYNTDGSLDSSFGGTGIVITQLTGDYDGASSVAIQADGKIVVAGSRFNCFCIDSSFAVVRYNPNGTLDTSFNGTGIVITSVNSSRDYGHSVAIQTDGKIVVAGSSGNDSNRDFALVRYNTDGSLDTTFNGTGKVITPVGGGNFVGGADSVAIQSDGKIIAAGESKNGFSAFTIVRYNPDGSLDTSFNGTGKVITSVGNSDSGARKLAIQTDGKIVVAGYSLGIPGNFISADFALVRYNPDGSLDASFNGTGKVITSVGNTDSRAYSVAIQSDGKIVAAGYSRNNIGSDFAVVRFNPNGSLDTTFNGTGSVITPFCCQSYAIAAAIQADGKIVVAGGTDDQLFDFYDFVVVRYQGLAPAACPNSIDCADFFVRQHYLDFLNREPDPDGLAFWTSGITSCGVDAQCQEVKRINNSAAFFLSIEFQESGYLVYRFYKSAFGNLPGAPVPVSFSDFLPDAQQIGHGVIVNQPGWQTVLENNKQAFATVFVQRPQFVSLYSTSMSPAGFVDSLFANAGVIATSEDRAAAINEFGGASTTADVAARSRALRRVAENSTLALQEFNRAFVLMQYFGYLRRNPNDAPDGHFAGYNFWLDKLNQFDGNFIQAEMVKAFLSSIEYRTRFGP